MSADPPLLQIAINFGSTEDDLDKQYKSIDEKYEKLNEKKTDYRKKAENYKLNPGQLVKDLAQENCSITPEFQLFVHSLRMCDQQCGTCYDPKDVLDYCNDRLGKICNKCHEYNRAYEFHMRNRRWKDSGIRVWSS